MVNACVLCRRSSRHYKKLGFHSFPLLRPEVLQKWVKAVNVEGFQATKSHRICSAHFEENNFQLGERKYLKEDAVPTLFLRHEERFLLKTQKKSDLNPEISHKSAEKTNEKPTKETTDSPVASGIFDNSQSNLFPRSKKIKVLNQVTQENIVQQQKSEKMVNSCVICRRGVEADETLSFHSFPVKRPEVLKKWLEAVDVIGFRVAQSSRICSDHFEDKDFHGGRGVGRKYLKEDAFPTLFMRREDRLFLKSQKKSDLNPEISHKSAEEQQKSEKIVHTCVLCQRNSQTFKKLSFHRFPFLRPKVLQKWVEAVEVEDFQATTTHRICSAHFGDEDFYFGPGGVQKHLKEHAFPTRFLHREEQPNAKPTKETTDSSIEETNSSAEETDLPDLEADISDDSDISDEVLHQVSQENIMEGMNIETASCSENIKTTANSTKKQLRKKIKNLQAQLRRRDKKIAHMKKIIFFLRRRQEKLLRGYGKSLQCVF